MVRIRNGALRQMFRPAVDKMSKARTSAVSSHPGGNGTQGRSAETRATGDDRRGSDKDQGGAISHRQPTNNDPQDPDTKSALRLGLVASNYTSSPASSIYSQLFQGRQPGQPVWASSSCYVRQTKPPTLTGYPLQATRSIPPISPYSVTPNMLSMSYSSLQATRPVLQKAKAEAYEIDLTEESVDTDTCGRADPRLRGMGVLPREWEYTAYGKAHLKKPRPGVELTVLSYNVLSQCLLEDNFYLYPHCPSHVLTWDNRRARLLEEMIAYHPDVLCLQEVQDDHYRDFFLPQLASAGYEGVYQKRTGNKPDGCAVFVKHDKLTVCSAFPIIYNRGNNLDRDNVALIVHLRPKNSTDQRQAEVFIATTHLLFNPRRGDIKLAQLSVLMAELDRLANRGTAPGGFPAYAPVILCGDFNAEPHSDIYKFVVRGYLRYEGLISRQISGQRERHSGKDVFLPRQLLHPSMGITDQCQYVRTLQQRNVPVPDFTREVTGECRQSQAHPADGPPPSRPSSLPDPTCPPWGARGTGHPGHRHPPQVSQGVGSLWHSLNFVSAYNHTTERFGRACSEITTQHDYASCTLDYIFYNVRKKRTHTQRNRVKLQNVEEDKLYLIARYGLLSAQEIQDLGGLPNDYLGSDHLGLLVKFLLKYS